MDHSRTDTQTEAPVHPAILLVDPQGNEVSGQGADLDPEGFTPGHILTLGTGRDKRHWRILEVTDDMAGEPGDAETAGDETEAAALRVTIEPAKSTLRWTLLLLGILGVSWFVLDYFFDLLFG